MYILYPSLLFWSIEFCKSCGLEPGHFLWFLFRLRLWFLLLGLCWWQWQFFIYNLYIKSISLVICSILILLYYLESIFGFKCIATHRCHNIILLFMVAACHLDIKIKKGLGYAIVKVYVPHADPCQPPLVPSRQLRFLVQAQSPSWCWYQVYSLASLAN